MQFATAFGIPIRVHWSFVALLALVGLYALFQGGVVGLFSGALVSFALFGSVVLHELGHALAARRYGISTAHITLYPFGGVAAIRGMPRTAQQELVIAIAGPAVNVAIAATTGAGAWLTGSTIIASIAVMNLILAGFNLIPAFPMDGGRVLRALLTKRLGWIPATEIAIRVGTAFAWGFLALGVIGTNLSLLLVGAFLLVALNAERRQLAWAASQASPPPKWAWRGTFRHPVP
jgi:Zn-dependent protease